MHLVAAAGEHAVGCAAIKAYLGKFPDQLLDERRVDAKGLEHLAVLPAHDRAVRTHRVDLETRKTVVADRQHRAARRGHHVRPEVDCFFDGRTDGPVRLVQAVEQGSIEVTGE